MIGYVRRSLTTRININILQNLLIKYPASDRYAVPDHYAEQRRG